MHTIEVDSSPDSPQTTVRFVGEVDDTAAHELLATGIRAIRDDSTGVVIMDLSGVTFIARVGIGAVLAVRMAAEKSDKTLRVVAATAATP